MGELLDAMLGTGSESPAPATGGGGDLFRAMTSEPRLPKASVRAMEALRQKPWFDAVDNVFAEAGISTPAWTHNVYRESAGKPTATGDGGSSMGLFQFNFAGGLGATLARKVGRKRAEEIARDPVESARVIAQVARSQGIHRIGDPVAQTLAFTQKVERPAARYVDQVRRELGLAAPKAAPTAGPLLPGLDDPAFAAAFDRRFKAAKSRSDAKELFATLGTVGQVMGQAKALAPAFVAADVAGHFDPQTGAYRDRLPPDSIRAARPTRMNVVQGAPAYVDQFGRYHGGTGTQYVQTLPTPRTLSGQVAQHYYSGRPYELPSWDWVQQQLPEAVRKNSFLRTFADTGIGVPYGIASGIANATGGQLFNLAHDVVRLGSAAVGADTAPDYNSLKSPFTRIPADVYNLGSDLLGTRSPAQTLRSPRGRSLFTRLLGNTAEAAETGLMFSAGGALKKGLAETLLAGQGSGRPISRLVGDLAERTLAGMESRAAASPLEWTAAGKLVPTTIPADMQALRGISRTAGFVGTLGGLSGLKEGRGMTDLGAPWRLSQEGAVEGLISGGELGLMMLGAGAARGVVFRPKPPFAGPITGPGDPRSLEFHGGDVETRDATLNSYLRRVPRVASDLASATRAAARVRELAWPSASAGTEPNAGTAARIARARARSDAATDRLHAVASHYAGHEVTWDPEALTPLRFGQNKAIVRQGRFEIGEEVLPGQRSTAAAPAGAPIAEAVGPPVPAQEVPYQRPAEVDAPAAERLATAPEGSTFEDPRTGTPWTLRRPAGLPAYLEGPEGAALTLGGEGQGVPEEEAFNVAARSTLRTPEGQEAPPLHMPETPEAAAARRVGAGQGEAATAATTEPRAVPASAPEPTPVTDRSSLVGAVREALAPRMGQGTKARRYAGFVGDLFERYAQAEVRRGNAADTQEVYRRWRGLGKLSDAEGDAFLARMVGRGRLTKEQAQDLRRFRGETEFVDAEGRPLPVGPDGLTIIWLTEHSNESTMVHELWHMFRAYMDEVSRKSLADLYRKETGREPQAEDGRLTQDFEEWVATHAEPAFEDPRVVRGPWKRVAQRFEQWVADLVRKLAKLPDLRVSPELRNWFDRYLTGERVPVRTEEGRAAEQAAAEGAKSANLGREVPEAAPMSGAPGTKQPWQMTQQEWDAEREASRPSGHALSTVDDGPRGKGKVARLVGNMARMADLIYGVPEWRRRQMTPEELADPVEMDWAHRPVTHREVIEKALEEGKPVPPEALAAYPDLRERATEAKRAPAPVVLGGGRNAEIAKQAKARQAEREAAPQVETPRPATVAEEGPVEGNIFDMNPDELDTWIGAEKERQDQIEVDVLGPELAQRWKTLHRVSNSVLHPERARAAYEEIKKIEASLPPDQVDRLYGIGEPEGSDIETARELRRRMDLDFESPEALGESLRFELTNLPEPGDPELSNRQQQAVAVFRYATERMKALGWDAESVLEPAIKAAMKRWRDPEDQAFMLNRFGEMLDQMKSRPPSKAAPALEPPQPVTPQVEAPGATTPAPAAQAVRATRAPVPPAELEAALRTVLQNHPRGDVGVALKRLRPAVRQALGRAVYTEVDLARDLQAMDRAGVPSSIDLMGADTMSRESPGQVLRALVDGKPTEWGSVRLRRSAEAPALPAARASATAQEDTVSSRLAGRKSVTIGTVTAGDQTFSLSLQPDASEVGTFSAVLTSPEGKRQSVRMKYRGGEPLSQIAEQLQAYLDEGNPNTFEVNISEPKPPTVPKTQDQLDRAELKRLEESRFKTAGTERKIERLKRRLALDPSKWRVGDGAGYRVSDRQINRGFRIVEVRPDAKEVVLRQVADTGLTATGADYERFPDLTWPMEHLVRDRKYDAPKKAATSASPEAAPAPEPPPANNAQVEAPRAAAVAPAPPGATSYGLFQPPAPPGQVRLFSGEAVGLKDALGDPEVQRLAAQVSDLAREGERRPGDREAQRTRSAAVLQAMEALGLRVESLAGPGYQPVPEASGGTWRVVVGGSPIPRPESAPGAAPAASSLFQGPLWFSRLARALDVERPTRQSGKQWEADLLKAGVKPEELRDTGLRDFLDQQTGSVSREALRDQFYEGQVEVHEVLRGPAPKLPPKLEWTAVESGAGPQKVFYGGAHGPNSPNAQLLHSSGEWRWKFYDKSGWEPTREEAEAALERVREEHYSQPGLKPKWASYTEPGGQNYRELLLTLPDFAAVKNEFEDGLVKAVGLVEADNYLARARVEDWDTLRPEIAKVAPRVLARYERRYARSSEPVESAHWDSIGNVIAHARFDERTDAEGRKVLHVAEIQSDWHQEGRQSGYLAPLAERERAQERVLSPEAVPDAPFKKSWPELVLKRLVRWAAENGFDRITWDTGDTQNERYSLGKQVSQITLFEDNELIAYDRDGGEAYRAVLTDPEKELPELIGKELAVRLLDQPLRSEADLPRGNFDFTNEGEDEIAFEEGNAPLVRSLSGEKMTVGGAGKRTFYDGILPRAAAKLFGPQGGRVTRTEVATGTEPVYHYEGPDATAEEFSDWRNRQIARRNDGTGEGFGSGTVGIEGQARDVASAMKGGKSLAQAMEEFGSQGLATKFGGEIKITNRTKTVPAHALDLSPQMRETALREGMALFQGPLPVREGGEAGPTKSPAFRAWFRASKVTDEKGRPRVVYHGTTDPGFSDFDPERQDLGSMAGPGFYFTEDPGVASGYGNSRPQYVLDQKITPSRMAQARRWFEGQDAAHLATSDVGIRAALRATWHALQMGPDAFARHLASDEEGWQRHFRERWQLTRTQTNGPGVYPVYLSLENPFDADRDYALEEAREILTRSGVDPEAQRVTLRGWSSRPQGVPGMTVLHGIVAGGPSGGFQGRLRAAGYDGITHMGGGSQQLQNGQWGPSPTHRVWVALSPEQVKSVHNSGTWSPEDPRLLFQGPLRRPGVDEAMEAGQAVWDALSDVGRGVQRVGSPGSVSPTGRAARENLQEKLGAKQLAEVRMLRALRPAQDLWSWLVSQRGGADLRNGFVDAYQRGPAEIAAWVAGLRANRPEIANRGTGPLRRGPAVADTLERLALTMHDLSKQRVAAIQALGTGKLEHSIEDYFPHLYLEPRGRLGTTVKRLLRGQPPRPAADLRTALLAEGVTAREMKDTGFDRWLDAQKSPVTGEAALKFLAESPQAASLMARGRRPLQGDTGFLKGRTYYYESEARASDLVPRFDNPVDAFTARLSHQDRYLAAQRFMAEGKGRGYVVFARNASEVPSGWRPLPDRVAEVFRPAQEVTGATMASGERVTATRTVWVPSGRYYAPPEVAALLENYLAPGLRSVPGMAPLFGANNLYNLFNLGLSGFHFTFTGQLAFADTLGEVVTRVELGQVGSAAKLAASLPVAPLRRLLRGGRLYRTLVDGGVDPAMSRYVAGVVASNLGIGMSRFERVASAEGVRRLFHERRYGGMLANLVPAAVELVGRPLMRGWVPWLKLGSYMDRLDTELAKLPNGGLMGTRPDGTTILDPQVRAVVQDSVRSVDNLFGQVNWDNRHLNRALKDFLQFTVRAPGWSFGSMDEVGMALQDALGGAGRLARGDVKGFLDKARSRKINSILSVLLSHALFAAVYQYAHTGQWPQDWTDLVYPKSGLTNPDGTPARSALPDYVKDAVAWSMRPERTAANKLSPLMHAAWSLKQNSDYMGVRIYNPEEKSILKKAMDILGWLAAQASPFFWRGYQRAIEEGASTGQAVEAFGGVTPLPRSLGESKAMRKLGDAAERLRPAGGEAPEEWERNRLVGRMATEERRLRRLYAERAKAQSFGDLGTLARVKGEIAVAEAKRDKLSQGGQAAHVTTPADEGKARLRAAKDPVFRLAGVRGMPADTLLGALEVAEPQEVTGLLRGWNLHRSEVAKLPEPQRTEARKRFEAVRTQVQPAGLLSDLLDGLEQSPKSTLPSVLGSWDRYAASWWAKTPGRLREPLLRRLERVREGLPAEFRDRVLLPR